MGKQLTYQELLAAYNKLLMENEYLHKEVDRLQSLLSSKGASSTLPAMKQHLSLEEKVDVFRNLFKGREDVFARRWYSRTSGKSGYQPVCRNEWDRQLCDKKKYKCTECPNRSFKPLEYEDIYRHLEGKSPEGQDVIGAYAIFADNTCNFLCADFDDKSCEHGYRKDVLAYVGVCKDWNVPCSIERSRSGNGAHVWMFFEQPLPASKARRLGNTILTEATERYGRMDFKSYDRFFPNQDILPDGGFGNLVALPLQGKARKEGNSVFVDENFVAYENQWNYLLEIKRISEVAVDTILAKHETASELGELSTTSESKPWETPVPQKLSYNDFPSNPVLIRSNMLYIPLQGFSAKVVNHLKRIASFKNPEFYARQGMRLSTYNIPRIISCADMEEDYIALPRGCEDAIVTLLENNKVAYRMEDKTHHGENIAVEFKGKLREEQRAAIASLTATSIRKDGHQPIIFMQCGPIRYSADAKKQMASQAFTRLLVPRFTSYRELTDDKFTYSTMIQKMAEDENRNRLITDDVCEALKEGRSPIVLTSLTAHVETLANVLTPHCKNVVTLVGSESAKEKRQKMEYLQNIPPSEPLVIVATGKYVGEGFDYPRLDTLFLALPVSWKGIIAQYAGRLHREYPGKKEVWIYDYIDIRVPMCNVMYKRRLKGYSSVGYQIKSNAPMDLFNESHSVIFNGHTYQSEFFKDLFQAKRSVVISATKLWFAKHSPVLDILKDLLVRGVEVVTVIKSNQEKEEQLKGTGASIRVNDSLAIDVAIIDKSLIWYGSVNYLGYNTDENNAIRIYDSTLAENIIEVLYTYT